MTNRRMRCWFGAGLAAVLAVALPFAASADVQLHGVDWETLPATQMVRFHLQWHNPDLSTTSQAVTGEVRAQEFGVFLPDQNVIGTFDVPPMAPDSFFDVFLEVSTSALPPSPPEGYTPKVTGGGLPPIPCPPGDHWDGNIDIIWGGPGGQGQVNYHIGQIMVCPGMGTSYIHMIAGCGVASAWAIAGVCPGWSVALLNEDRTAAPNPVPANWTGWIAVSAGPAVPVGQICCFTVSFTCGGQIANVNLCATACQCPTVDVERSTWGMMKQLYR